jgi:hypothetical protein
MRRGQYRTGWLAAAGLAIAFAIPVPCLAYGSAFHPVQQHHAAATPPPQHPQPPRQAQGLPQHAGHRGDWLRRYKDLPPAEQERELQKDPAFLRLPPAKQKILRQRLQNFSSLSPQQQLRILNRQETWEHLTPEQKQQALQFHARMQQLPPDRRRLVHTAIDDLRAMPPAQREKVINSERFKGTFSDQEREMMRGATRLPLAPAEGGENETQP